MSMSEALTVSEFPFASSMPASKKHKVRDALSIIDELSAEMDKSGIPLPKVYVAQLLGVTPQRITVLVANGTLETVQMGKVELIKGNSVREYFKSDRKPGRPTKKEWSRGAVRTIDEVADGMAKIVLEKD